MAPLQLAQVVLTHNVPVQVCICLALPDATDAVELHTIPIIYTHTCTACLNNPLDHIPIMIALDSANVGDLCDPSKSSLDLSAYNVWHDMSRIQLCQV